jgi:putative DNA primase/helicase
MACTTSLADEVSAADPWLWPQRVALGSLTLVVGDPGVGKSYLTLDMAARVSRGGLWPEEELAGRSEGTSPTLAAPAERAPGGTLLLCAEDDYANTVRPRLVALGADLAKISALRDSQGDQAFDLLPYLPDFERQIQSTPNARLWIIDPISSYLGNLQENHDRSIRGLLNPLANLAAAHQLAIVLVTHLSKGDGKALHRVLGSRAFGAAARNVWLVAEDAEDDRRRLLVSVKQNRTAPPTGLAFTIESVGTSGCARLLWVAEPLSVDADEALAATAYQPPPRNQRRRQVIAWLEELLADGSLPPGVVRESAAARGIACTTLRRAFREMGGQSYWEKRGTSSVRLWRLGPEPNAE